MADEFDAGRGLGPYELDTIVTGDARELSKAIPDESVDLIFTDPVYDRIDDYRWLAETAARVLKPNSACLAWIANPRIFEIGAVMGEALNFVMPLNYVRPGNTYMIFSRRVFMWSAQCLWYEKGKSKLAAVMPDAIVSYQATSGTHKWNKNPEAFVKWMQCFVPPGATVFDPFTGGGTVAAVCKTLGRHYLAFEIDAAVAERARERVRNTQPPLFVPDAVQLTLDAAGDIEYTE